MIKYLLVIAFGLVPITQAEEISVKLNEPPLHFFLERKSITIYDKTNAECTLFDPEKVAEIQRSKPVKISKEKYKAVLEKSLVIFKEFKIGDKYIDGNGENQFSVTIGGGGNSVSTWARCQKDEKFSPEVQACIDEIMTIWPPDLK